MDKLEKNAPMVSLWLFEPQNKRPSEEEEEKEEKQ
jgi:hypothetical protein